MIQFDDVAILFLWIDNVLINCTKKEKNKQFLMEGDKKRIMKIKWKKKDPFKLII